MGRGMRQQLPALVVAGLALVAALSGTVYAAKAGKISGKSIKVKSLPGNRLAVGSVPGNRLAVGSVPGNRLKPGALRGNQLAPGSVTGIQIDASTIGQVPSAVHAESAGSAQDAETALNAANAENARTVNGYEAGCKAGTVPFAGACWQSEPSASPQTATAAAVSCAGVGGELPDALSLVAYSQQPGVSLANGDEWSGDLTNVSGVDLYAAITVSSSSEVSSAVSTASKKFRCVIPLVG